MNLSYSMSRSSQSILYEFEIVSQCSFGFLPLASAEVAIFSPCSSVPVINITFFSSNLWKRAMASAAMVVYALPMCGGALT
uniref:OVA1 n=1 Tax=Arundo donax TaxID=35708 RepID=A0A0A9CTP5_ARUDO